MDFESMIGKVAGFHGVDGNTFKLGKHVFEAVEDPDDGYRSCLATVATKADPSGLIFFRRAVAQVRVERVADDRSFEGYRLVDVDDGHVWLRLGTDETDDYYPTFTFEYAAKAPKTP